MNKFSLNFYLICMFLYGLEQSNVKSATQVFKADTSHLTDPTAKSCFIASVLSSQNLKGITITHEINSSVIFQKTKCGKKKELYKNFDKKTLAHCNPKTQ